MGADTCYWNSEDVDSCQEKCTAEPRCEGAHYMTHPGHCCLKMNIQAPPTLEFRENELTPSGGWELMVNSRASLCQEQPKIACSLHCKPGETADFEKCICVENPYKFGYAGSNNCPSGYVPILTINECEAATNVLAPGQWTAGHSGV